MPMYEVLIVEDSPTQAEHLVYTLKQNGYKVTAARNGREALELLGSGLKPTIIVTDIVMPGIDGLALCKEIKNDETLRDIPVILLTALSDPEDVLKGLECGADNFITKPYDERSLLSSLQHILGNAELRKESKMQMGLEILFRGKKYFITSERQQILDLLLSSYEAAVSKSHELSKAQKELEELNEQLEEKIKEKTASLRSEMEERKRAEAQLLQAQKMEAIGQLAGGIAHDFNNILSAILGYGHLLRDKLVEDPLRLNAEQIIESAERGAEVTHGLLAFSRKQMIRPKPIRINSMIGKFEKLLCRIIGEDIELRTTLPDEDLCIMADEGQIGQALMNLATNARDAMPDGGILTISAGTKVFDDSFVRSHGYGTPGKFALITVSDTGVGMSKETVAKIFEPFFTTKGPGKGTGLGLSIVYGITKQHDGFINVYSEPGKGTTFRIYLPLIKLREEVSVVTPAKSVVRAGNETVLVAEDDSQLRKLGEIVLKEYGYKVILAENGEEAVKRFVENKDDVQLLLLDMIMPKKGGKEAYEEIKRIKPDIKVLFATGYTADRVSRDSLIEEGLNFVLKPVSPKDLLIKIREVLDKE